MLDLDQTIARTISGLGGSHLFTLMGGGNIHLVHYLETEYGISVHHLRHENAVVGAADGFARATGDVGWCTVSFGPGFTNTLTALRTADMARSALVLITPDSSQSASPFAGGVQGLSPRPLLDALGIRIVDINADNPAQSIGAAFRLAQDESRPVALLVPADLQAESTSEAVDAAAAAALTPSRELVAPDAADVDEVVALLASASRVLVLAGRGAVAAGAEQAVSQLAERFDADVFTTVRGIGLFHGSPRHRGVLGGFTADPALPAIEEADCVVAIGASLNKLQTRKAALLEGKRLVQIDADPAVFGKHVQPDVALRGDALLTVQMILDRAGERSEASRPIHAIQVRDTYLDVSRPGELDPRTVCEEFDRLLPERRAVVVDTGHFSAFPVLHMDFRAPDELLWMLDFGAVGSAIGASIGAAVARPDRSTALVIGDCGFFMTLGDLEPAVREQIPLLVICLNDGAAGSELIHLSNAGLPRSSAIFGMADFAAIARAMGAQAETVNEISDIGQALEAWRPELGPLVLDCRITREVRARIRAHTG